MADGLDAICVTTSSEAQTLLQVVMALHLPQAELDMMLLLRAQRAPWQTRLCRVSRLTCVQ